MPANLLLTRLLPPQAFLWSFQSQKKPSHRGILFAQLLFRQPEIQFVKPAENPAVIDGGSVMRLARLAGFNVAAQDIFRSIAPKSLHSAGASHHYPCTLLIVPGQYRIYIPQVALFCYSSQQASTFITTFPYIRFLSLILSKFVEQFFPLYQVRNLHFLQPAIRTSFFPTS